jgi:probable F420-dependent oxidoreductase
VKVGVLFPQTEIGTDPTAVRDFAQTAEELGFTHLLAFEHVLGVDPALHEGWEGYTNQSQFHEPFVLFGHLAGLTRTIEFGTVVLVLPQRQTALVAKQAAEVDLLSGGRLRLGIGVGYNAQEFAGLGEDFSTRGARCEEQIALMRALWTQESVIFEGQFDHLHGVGISPLPKQQPIPLWIGGMSPIVLDRVGRLADGWFPMVKSPDRLGQRLQRVHDAARAAGRLPGEIGVDVVLWPHVDDEHLWRDQLGEWVESGTATHLTFATLETGFAGLQNHLDAITRFRRIAEDLGI